MMNSIYNFLFKFDIFGYTIRIKHRSNNDFKSIYGALFTLLVYIILIVQIIFSFNQMKSSMNPLINTYETQENYNQTMQISSEDYIFKLGLIGNKPKGYYIDLINDSFKIVIKTINPEFEKIHKYILTEDGILYNEPIYLINRYTEGYEQYLSIDFEIKDESKLKDFEGEEILFYFPNSYFDMFDFERPIKDQVSTVRWSVEDLKDYYYNRKFMETSINLNHNEFNEIFNILIDPMMIPKRDFYCFRPNSDSSTIKIQKGKKNFFLRINLKVSIFNNKLFRRYMTPVDLLSDIGGLFSMLSFFGMSVFGFINKHLFLSELMNKYFKIRFSNYSDNKLNETLINKKSIVYDDYHSQNNNDNESKTESNRQSKSEYNLQSKQTSSEDIKMFRRTYNSITKTQMTFSKDMKRFKYGITDILNGIVCWDCGKNKYKNEVFQKGKTFLDSYFSIHNFINVNQDFRVIKYYLFDYSKLNVIEDLKKPIINIYSDTEFNVFTYSGKEINTYLKKRFISFKDSPVKKKRKNDRNVEIEMEKMSRNSI